MRAARNQDPASALVLSHIANVYLQSGQLDSALGEIHRALEIDSTNVTTMLFAGQIYLKAKRFEEAHAVALRRYNERITGYLLAASGDVDGAREVLRRQNALPPKWGDEQERAFTYLGLGDSASALSALERSTNAGELWVQSSQLGSAMYDPIRKSARFRELLKRVGLGEYVPSLTR